MDKLSIVKNWDVNELEMIMKIETIGPIFRKLSKLKQQSLMTYINVNLFGCKWLIEYLTTIGKYNAMKQDALHTCLNQCLTFKHQFNQFTFCQCIFCQSQPTKVKSCHQLGCNNFC